MAILTGAAFDNSNLTNFFNVTMAKIDKDVRDAVFTRHTFMRYLKQIGSVKEDQTGDGCHIIWETAQGGNVAARAFTSSVELTDPDIHRYGYEDFAEYTGAIPISHTVLQKNAGPERLIPYLDSRKKNMEKSMAYRINYDAMNGSGTFPSMVGISNLISITPTTGTIHGVARSGNTYVQNQQKDSTCSTTVGFGLEVIHDTEVLLKEASKGMGDREFDLALMDKTVHSNMTYYLPSLANSQRVVITGNGSRNIPGDQLKYAGENTFYLGDALAIWDFDAPSDSIRWFSKDTLQMRILRNCNFVTRDTQAERSFNRAILLGVSANMVCVNPKYTAVLNAFSS